MGTELFTVRLIVGSMSDKVSYNFFHKSIIDYFLARFYQWRR